MNRNVKSRILRQVAIPVLLLAAVSNASQSVAPAQAGPKSKVVTVRSPKAINSRNQCDAAEVKAMLEQGLQALTATTNAREAWLKLGLTAEDVIGVKVNCNNWTISLSPHNEVVAALTESLSSVVPLNNIIFYDMRKADLEEAGFKRNASANGVRFMASDADAGYDDQERLTRIVTSLCTKLVNLASLKTVAAKKGDGILDVSLFFKNHVGSLTSKDAPKSHDDPDFMAGLLARPSIRKKTILNLCDGLRGSYRRGVPWYWGGIVLGVDPVASEYVAVQIINDKRIQEKGKPLETPRYLAIAEKKHGLGTCQPGNIDWIRLER